MASPRAPYRSEPMTLKPEWIDYNGHLNLAYYHVLFDVGVDGLYEAMGLGAGYRNRTGFTTYTAEAHVRYLRELAPDATVTVVSQIVGVDEKRLHLFQEIRHRDGWLAATLESLALSIDQRGEAPKVAPFPPETASSVLAVARAHAALDRPADLARQIRQL